MTHASLTYTEAPHPSCMKISIPIPSWWKFNRLIDLKVECYDVELGVRIDGVFYTNTLTPILGGVSHPSSITKIDILLTDMLRTDILFYFTSGRGVPKIKITGIGKPSGTLTTTHNGFTAI